MPKIDTVAPKIHHWWLKKLASLFCMLAALLFPVIYAADDFCVAFMVTVSSSASHFLIHHMTYLFVSPCQDRSSIDFFICPSAMTLYNVLMIKITLCKKEQIHTFLSLFSILKFWSWCQSNVPHVLPAFKDLAPPPPNIKHLPPPML